MSTTTPRCWTFELYSAPILEPQRLGRLQGDIYRRERLEAMRDQEVAAAEERRDARRREAEARVLAKKKPEPKRQLASEPKIIGGMELQKIRDEVRRLEKVRAKKIAERDALLFQRLNVPRVAGPSTDPPNIAGLITNREGFRKHLARTMGNPPEPWTESFRSLWFAFNAPGADGISPNEKLLMESTDEKTAEAR